MENGHDFPLISIITVNLNGKTYLNTLFDSLKEQEYPADRLEMIMVDNGSGDGSVELVQDSYPDVKIIKNPQNTGFAAANNQGAKMASGSYLAFINNDARADKRWLVELFNAIPGDKETVCAGSKVLSLDGKNIDFAGGMINFEGKGFQVDYGIPVVEGQHNQALNIPFANGGAMMVDREVFLDSGGFDEGFFAYYEDVDFGWRLWVLGYKVILAPQSIIYHAHHGTSRIFPEDKLRFLKERNSLYSVFKNYDDQNLARVFSGSLASIYNRIFVDVDFDYRKYYDLNQQPPSKDAEVNIGSEPLSSLMAVKNFLDELPLLQKKRNFIQSRRRRDDKAVFSYFKGSFLAVSPDPEYQEKQVEILKSLGIYQVFEKQIKRKLLIVASEVVSSQMAGPAIRAWNFARVLSEYMEVVLAVPNEVDITGQGFRIEQYKDEMSMGKLLSDCDIAICTGMTFSKFKVLRDSDKYLVMDIYDPYNLATLVEYKDEPLEKQFEVFKSVHANMNEMLYYGDFFICASERQRDFWLGMLAVLKRLNPYTFNQDPSMRKLIDVVPFGLDSAKPTHKKNVLRGVWDGIGKEDFVIIWGGGIYNWFDPLTLVKAMGKVAEKRKDIKLFFLGVKHPNPQVRELSLVNQTVELARKLELEGKNIFFNFGWVDYNQRQDYLLESDIGIITYPQHIETRFAFRTRILDYLWTGLPIITSKGDSLSQLVEKEGLGLAVEARNVEELAKAILFLAGDKDYYNLCRKKISQVSPGFQWEKICQPLIDFCKDPVASAVRKKLRAEQVHTADDVLGRVSSSFYETGDPDSGGLAQQSQVKGTGYLIKRFFHHFFRHGPKKTMQIYRNYARETS